MEDHRRILLYGDTLILDSVGALLRTSPGLDLVSLSPPFPALDEVEALTPDAVIFDIESTRLEVLLSLLETQPGLLLLGVSAEGNVIRLWSGRQLREISGKELKDVIEEQLAARLS